MNRLNYLTYIKFHDLPRDENGGYTVEALNIAYTDGVMSKNIPDLPTEQYVTSLIDDLNEMKFELNRYKAIVPKWFAFIKTFKIRQNPKMKYKKKEKVDDVDGDELAAYQGSLK